jgi:hypothetical protein
MTSPLKKKEWQGLRIGYAAGEFLYKDVPDPHQVTHYTAH